MSQRRASSILAVAALATVAVAAEDVATAAEPPARALAAEAAPSDGPIVPLPKAETEPAAAAPPSRPAPGVAPPRASALTAPAPAPSLLDPFPGTPGGPPLPPGAVVEEALPLVHRASLQLAGSARLGEGPKNLPPRYGFAIGATLGRRLAALGPRVSLWGTADFFYNRFGASKTEAGDESILSQTSFVLLPAVSADLGKLSLWLGAGAGYSLGAVERTAQQDFNGTAQVVDSTAHELVVRAAVGFDYAWQRQWSVGARVAFSSPVWPNEPLVATGEPPLQPRAVFGPWADAGLTVQYRF